MQHEWARLPLICGSIIALGISGAVLVVAATSAMLDGLLGVGRHRACTGELYAVNADGSGHVALTHEPGWMHWGPALSPDGRTLVYTFATPPEPGHLVLADPDGTNRRPLTTGERGGYLPAWSPDGTTLAYIVQAGGDLVSAELAVINADGRNSRLLTNNDAQEYGASWSPDGWFIAFGSKKLSR